MVRTNREWMIVGLCLLLLTVALTFVPIVGGDDWRVFYNASRSLLDDTPLYGTPHNPEEISDGGYFYNVPWVAVIGLPTAIGG
jgi:hypothetical protein